VAVKLRLMRMGKKKQPTYRVVAADSRSPRDGRFIEVLGFYNPRSEPSVIEIDNDKAVGWLRNGAKPTERVQKLLTVSGAWSEFTGQAGPTPYVAPAPANAPAAAPAAVADSEDEPVAASNDSSEEE
jgi:small subunit ribosomal protein S16